MTGFWTTERDDRLRAMRAEGMSFSIIAGLLGCGRNSAIGRAHRIGIVAAPRPRSEGGRPSKPRPVSVPKQKPWRPPSNPKPDIPVELPSERPRRAGKPCGIMEVTGCRFINGDVRGEHFYCNAPRIEGTSYCPEHAAICFGRQP